MTTRTATVEKLWKKSQAPDAVKEEDYLFTSDIKASQTKTILSKLSFTSHVIKTFERMFSIWIFSVLAGKYVDTLQFAQQAKINVEGSVFLCFNCVRVQGALSLSLSLVWFYCCPVPGFPAPTSKTSTFLFPLINGIYDYQLDQYGLWTSWLVTHMRFQPVYTLGPNHWREGEMSVLLCGRGPSGLTAGKAALFICHIHTQR